MFSRRPFSLNLARLDGCPTCYPDCNADGVLDALDFACFHISFGAAASYADCNADAAHTIADFACFQSKFVTGCP